MTWFAAGAAIAAAAISATSAIKQGEAARKSANTQADWTKKNEEISAQQAGAREEALRRDTRQQLGRMAAAQAQSGVDATSGSSLMVAAQSATMAELDALNVRYGNEIDRFGMERQVGLLRSQGKAAQDDSYFKAASAIVGAAASYGKAAGGPSNTGGTPTTAPMWGVGNPNAGP